MNTIVAMFAGDSGDGVQLLGSIFSDAVARSRYTLKTFPDYPAEIRSPQGTIHGVSGFQIQWGDSSVHTAGDHIDILIAFNAAGYQKFKSNLTPQALIIYDPDGFDTKNCKLSNLEFESFVNNPYAKLEVKLSQLTIDALSDFDINIKQKQQNKNIFALAMLVYAVEHQLDHVQQMIESRFGNKPQICDAMIRVLTAGFHYADTIEFSFAKSHTVTSNNQIKPGKYRNIQGNTAIALALISANYIYDHKVFFAGYPITPASDILHELVKYSQYEGIDIQQAEDEIAAVSMAIGAAYGGAIAATASSGPGIDLKQEAIGLAVTAELPILVIDVMRAGPSTGMPTKLEQSDLNLVYYGRHGDSVVPIVAIRDVQSTYETTLQAIQIMMTYQTPIYLLSDVSIANGSESWKLPQISKRSIPYFDSSSPHDRNPEGVLSRSLPGTPGKQRTIGGLEKSQTTGAISYDPSNHQAMTELRANKVMYISQILEPAHLEPDSSTTGTLWISWGSTYGSVCEALSYLRSEGDMTHAHLHIDWIRPFRRGIADILSRYQRILVVELNMGQLARIISSEFGVTTHQISKVQGIPFTKQELIDAAH